MMAASEPYHSFYGAKFVGGQLDLCAVVIPRSVYDGVMQLWEQQRTAMASLLQSHEYRALGQTEAEKQRKTLLKFYKGTITDYLKGTSVLVRGQMTDIPGNYIAGHYSYVPGFLFHQSTKALRDPSGLDWVSLRLYTTTRFRVGPNFQIFPSYTKRFADGILERRCTWDDSANPLAKPVPQIDSSPYVTAEIPLSFSPPPLACFRLLFDPRR